MDEITLEFFSDIADLWPVRDRYMRRDIIPSLPDGAWGVEDERWFFSKDYYDHFEMLFHRKADRLKCGRFLLKRKFIGFFEYIVYTSEDGKGFIIEFGLEPEYRDRGVGSTCYSLLEKRMRDEGAIYLQLNASGDGPVHFWEKNGFSFAGKDEHGGCLFEKRF